MSRFIARPFAAFGLAFALLALGGCSAAEQLPYPKFSSVKKVTKKLLSREEQDAAIEQLAVEREKQQEQAQKAK